MRFEQIRPFPIDGLGQDRGQVGGGGLFEGLQGKSLQQFLVVENVIGQTGNPAYSFFDGRRDGRRGSTGLVLRRYLEGQQLEAGVHDWNTGRPSVVR